MDTQIATRTITTSILSCIQVMTVASCGYDALTDPNFIKECNSVKGGEINRVVDNVDGFILESRKRDIDLDTGKVIWEWDSNPKPGNKELNSAPYFLIFGETGYKFIEYDLVSADFSKSGESLLNNRGRYRFVIDAIGSPKCDEAQRLFLDYSKNGKNDYTNRCIYPIKIESFLSRYKYTAISTSYFSGRLKNELIYTKDDETVTDIMSGDIVARGSRVYAGRRRISVTDIIPFLNVPQYTTMSCPQNLKRLNIRDVLRPPVNHVPVP